MKQCRRAGFAQQMSSFLSRQRVRRFERGDEWGKKLGGGQKKGEKVLLIANRTQAVVSLTVYDVLYIYMYMHSAMWPVDSSSSSSLFFSFPSSIASFIKTNPPLLLLGRRVEAWQWHFRLRTFHHRGWTSPRSRQTGRPECFSSPFHVFSPPPFIRKPCFLLLSSFFFSFFLLRNDENTYLFLLFFFVERRNL